MPQHRLETKWYDECMTLMVYERIGLEEHHKIILLHLVGDLFDFDFVSKCRIHNSIIIYKWYNNNQWIIK